jgi:hypothetical protein
MPGAQAASKYFTLLIAFLCVPFAPLRLCGEKV